MPKIEQATRYISIVHFLLMFGYKMFSLYFPLFLLAKHFSVPQVGYATFFIYLPIALGAPFIGFLNHRLKTNTLILFGVMGYAMYTLGMIFVVHTYAVYLFQIILGIAAALFFVSTRALIMRSRLANQDESFAWFYVAPAYADAVAPAVGALLIWRFGFTGLFLASLIVYAITMIYALVVLRDSQSLVVKPVSFRQSLQNYRSVVGRINHASVLPYILICFLMLTIAGFTNTFFVVFLKQLGWTQNTILLFNSLLALVLLPISFWVIRIIKQQRSEANIVRGNTIIGVLYVVIGLVVNSLNFYLAFLLMLGNNIGELMMGSGRSGLMANIIKEHPEESAAVDTIFSPLARSLASLVGGSLIVLVGYPMIFIGSGILAILSGIVVLNIKK